MTDPVQEAVSRAIATTIDEDNTDSLLVLVAREALKPVQEAVAEDITEAYDGEDDTFVAGFNAALRLVREYV
ncbi:hypothetical protein BH762_gp119 [Gordonia phage OneUp]|uniref:Uncharacterized protein n=1 Tax=Gordonia phage OneUp TaxID=1838074 RepID=A0A160DEQ5_9CAUD|nr:hypothetical protein BH762_gp119 [Gordonia phage OneUp]ANA86400.1 hypothetical protein PBI_ONEUP_65 [Gordonia phage OneUp]